MKSVLTAALSSVGVALLAVGVARAFMPAASPDVKRAERAGVAYLAIDLRTGKTVASENASQLDRPILPGSVAGVATLAAALESGVISGRTGVACTRHVTVAGHPLTCAHPDFHRPLQAAEALAQSCDVFFATVGGRLARPSFDRALASLGLPLSDRRMPVAAAAVGVEGIRAAPTALIAAIARIADQPSRLPWKAATLETIREGLHDAARTGTASALAAHGIDALAKTATTIATAGGAQGVVVGVTPASKPTIGFVLLASGAAGLDAAELAAQRLELLKTKVAVPAPAPARDTSARASSGREARTPAPSATPSNAPSARTIRVGIARGGGGYDVRTMPLEDYVAGVLVGEAARNSSPAALEALAITVRTFAMANLGRHRSDGFDLCDQTHCQVLRKPTPAATRAATATAGRILLYRGAPASIFYTASCGGHTERPSDVWPGADNPDFLPAREDDACEGQPVWSTELAAGDLARALRSGGFKGSELRNLRVAARSGSGRVTRLRVEGFAPDEISGQDLRTIVGRTLGWQFIKSTAFDLRRTSTGFRFEGHGSGHGVGMCVIGAANLGAHGKSSSEILARYFPGLAISTGIVPATTTIATDVVVSLPAGDEGQRDAIRDLAVRARDALARQLGVAAPARMALRFHPTVESYQRATGQPWFTAGAVVEGRDADRSEGKGQRADREMHFVPLTVLRDRGVLEKTVRHEIVHLLTAQALAGRPLWVREGAASYFADERHSAIKAPCPTDRELMRPISPGALSNAYTRAEACFARQIASGRKWFEVK